MQDDSRRRIATIARHLQPLESPVNEIPQPGSKQVFATQHTAAKKEAAIKSSYAKVHGEVSEQPASWTGIPVVQKTALQEVIYQKAVREGIAKVSICDPFFACCWAASAADLSARSSVVRSQGLLWPARSPSTAHTSVTLSHP